MKGIGFASLGLYFSFGLILGFLIPIPQYRMQVLGICTALGVLEWCLLGIGYIWPKMRYKLPNIGLTFFAIISLGIFLPALGLSVLLVKHNQ